MDSTAAMTTDHSPPQRRIYRAVAGAVRNAAHGHPAWKITRVMENSIAKRATGTLTAQWREVLAAKPSDRCGLPPYGSCSTRAHRFLVDASRGGAPGARRSPLRHLHVTIGAMAAQARYAGQTEREQALVEVLRLIAEVSKS